MITTLTLFKLINNICMNLTFFIDTVETLYYFQITSTQLKNIILMYKSEFLAWLSEGKAQYLGHSQILFGSQGAEVLNSPLLKYKPAAQH